MTQSPLSLRASSFRTAVAAYVSVLLAVLVLHYPFGEYRLSRTVVVRAGQGDCPAPLTDVERIKSMSTEELNRIYEQGRLCRSETEQQVISPLEWRSEEPLIDWFGPLKNVLVTLFASAVGVAVWLWAYGAKSGRASEA